MLINDRFEVDLLRGEVSDRETGAFIRVEPRLIKLLCLLAEHRAKPVSRKTIVKEIWNDYPGGDEGLNQAISVLRKMLGDTDKRIIETLPKMGYCFHGTCTAHPVASKPKTLKAFYKPVALFLLLIVAFALGYYRHRATGNNIVPGKPSHEESALAFKLDSKESERTAIKMDSAGKLDSKEGARAIKMDSAGKLDSKEGERPARTDDQERRSAGKSDSGGK